MTDDHPHWSLYLGPRHEKRLCQYAELWMP
jgi:hypothetical protein